MSKYMVVAGRGKVKADEDFLSSCITYSSGSSGRSESPKRLSAYERTKKEVYATGNKWAIENFHATHD